MSFRFVRPLLCAALLLPVGLAPAMAAGATCSPTKMKIRTVTGTISTNSTTFQPITDTSITFTQGGTGPSCVVVRFSAATSVVGGGVSRVQAVLDNVTMAEPGQVQFSGENVGSVSHAFEFLFPSVAPGSHNLRIMFRVGVGTTRCSSTSAPSSCNTRRDAISGVIRSGRPLESSTHRERLPSRFPGLDDFCVSAMAALCSETLDQ